MTVIGNKAVVLFQGDSITDCGRNREVGSSLGTGYANLIASEFGFKYPEKNVTFLNRGISGNRVVDLEGRWQEDCLDLKPTMVSIYIGINDTWRKYDSNNPTSAESYYEGYRRLIINTKESLDASLILIEPFVLPVPEDRRGWREDLDPKITAVRSLAEEFKTLYVPLDGLFAAASMSTGASYWAGDGVHPSPAGHGLIADAWLRAVGAKG
ncbi:MULTISPECIES: SGNH/GDSL hydrolase family protein [Paenibacillus]|jgi:acyl-CoA thioesterase-1|uniref:SGNH/GDSL hydrolase family protein n=1 Tax=Paenibacillus TaxID=44249 RepID=UPI00164DA2C9|nr:MULTISPECIES: SGNH/GDSL hydrolase family protein [Paenibacillus]QNK55176.1 SGNH/GDSL hydrolase family protein [Paenibacillus sp. PAMC21692]